MEEAGPGRICEKKEHSPSAATACRGVCESTLGVKMLWTVVHGCSGSEEVGSLVYGNTVRNLKHRDHDEL